jgi:hypothetical protein
MTCTFVATETHATQQEQTVRLREDNARHFNANELLESSINMSVNTPLISITDSKQEIRGVANK